MDEIKEILGKMLKELTYHGKLLEELLQEVNSRKHDHKASLMEMKRKIMDVSAKMGDNPMAKMMMESLEALMGTRREG